jgi:chemotaxis regulatin CheY-phosphate phosphatase CheZ
MVAKIQTNQLAEQILQLVDYITKIKSELAAIKHPKSSVDHFNTVAEQLNTICETTEIATNDIMESAEAVLNAVDELSANVKYPEAQASCNAIMDSTNKIFESCSFHDLTGQRISKIVRIMKRLEQTLDSLVEIVGPEGLAEMPVEGDGTIEDVIGMRDGDIAMHGPQVAGKEVSQNDIDALFGSGPTPAPSKPADSSQADIDSMFDKPAAAPKPASNSQADIDSMFDKPAPAPKTPPAGSGETKKEVSQDDIDKMFN